jgi:hypothetical protein
MTPAVNASVIVELTTSRSELTGNNVAGMDATQ